MDRYLLLLSYGPEGWGDELVQGALITIGLAIATLPFGLALGLLVALAARSPSRMSKRVATVYTTVFRGVPELLTLYIVYYGMQMGLQRLWRAIGFPGSFEMNSFVAGMIALGLVLAAFSSEVWVGALNAIPRGQREGAAALGLSKGQTFRLVILPQLLRVALPGLGNNWMVLLKETSLVSTIALADLMFVANRANVVTKEPFLFFGVASGIYMLFSLVSTGVLDQLEARANRGYRTRA
ncbi:ABC transporter permease subunit [Chelatococcus sp. SYSU_G07232]|uniref:ABC transporter permease subunit n=1 Tax=Chelatococcus albus TaxID=3047466 RepID=A0ABT7AMN1_9HYPH|nr:ABC transporter permease subunit [Chelatococcus sp. SYSU_G07232]MDJ1159806.1 ABC transporter permease subunit [Chelatococcus sp. SYSU_G07232]